MIALYIFCRAVVSAVALALLPDTSNRDFAHDHILVGACRIQLTADADRKQSGGTPL